MRLLIALILFTGCAHTSASSRQFVEQGPTDSPDLIILLHGKGGSADRFLQQWQSLPSTAQIASAQGFVVTEDGAGWFNWSPEMGEAGMIKVLSESAAKVWPGIEALAHGRKVIIVGYSQGAMMAMVLAAAHPEAIRFAYAVAGGIPSALITGAAAPVYAIHGTADQVVPIQFARSTIEALKARGNTAELHEIEGLTHRLTPEVIDEVSERVKALTERR